MQKNITFINAENSRIVNVEFYYTTESFDYQDSKYFPEDCYFEAFYTGNYGYEPDGAISEHFGKITKALGLAEKTERIQWFIKYMQKQGWCVSKINA